MSKSPTRRKKRRADATPRSFDVVERALLVELRRVLRTPARRETNRHHVAAGCKHGRWTSVAIVVAGLLGNLKVFGQFIDRGAVDMSCDEECYCEGDSDDGTITVFDIPSSGERVAAVDGQYLEVLETSCDTSVISVGENLYDLSGVDLETRIMEVVETSSIDCAETNFGDASSDAECFSGTSETYESDGVDMTMTFYVQSTSEGSSVTYKSIVNLVVQGTGDFDPDVGDVKVCVEQGFVSQIFTATVQDNDYMFNYELVIPGEDTSSDLSVTSTPSSAGDFACGIEADPTPAPINPPTTPAPLGLAPAEPKPTVEPTSEPTSYPTPGYGTSSPIPKTGATPELTPDVTIEPRTNSPAQPAPTSEPISKPTSYPTPGYGTSSPEPNPMPTPEATPDVTMEPSNPSPREPFPTPPSSTTSVEQEPTPAPTTESTSDPTSGPTTEAMPTPRPEVNEATPESTFKPTAQTTPPVVNLIPQPSIGSDGPVVVPVTPTVRPATPAPTAALTPNPPVVLTESP